MEIVVRLEGKKRVSADFDGYNVVTDQPKEDGGDGAAPAPFDLFLASLATCAGFFIQSFCQTRNIPTEGIKIRQTSTRDEKTHLVSNISIEVELPGGFPEKYKKSVLAAADQCSVKRHLQNPPAMQVVLKG